jgi:Ca2+-binding RTX toxin-like protein
VAPTILNPGDIAIVGYVTNGSPDLFSFVNLVSIEAGTIVYFTNNGWTGTGFNGVTSTDADGEENLIQFTAISNIAAGTVIRSTDTSPNFTWTKSGSIGAGGDYRDLSLTESGEQIAVLQSTNTTNPLLSDFKAIYQIDNTSAFEDATSTSTGSVISDLSENNTAVLLNNQATSGVFDLQIFSSGTREEWLKAISNSSNWKFSNDTSLPSDNIIVSQTPNNIPTAANSIVTFDEDTAYAFTTTDFKFADTDSSDTLKSIVITETPIKGQLFLDSDNDGKQGSNEAISKNQSIKVTDFGKLKFKPAENANGDNYTSFQFKVSDGKDTSISAYKMTLNVTPVNDAPTAGNGSINLDEDAVYTFTNGDFKFASVDSDDSLQAVQITQLPDAGKLFLDNNNDGNQDADELVATGQTIEIADLTKLKFKPDKNANGDGYTSFQFKVSDGKEMSAEAYTITANVRAINDAPTADNNTVSLNEDNAYTFSAADFKFQDVDTSNTLQSIKITGLPLSGQLFLDGNNNNEQDISEAIPENYSIPVSALSNLKYRPGTDGNGDGYSNFQFKVSDGTDLSTLAYTMAFNVAPVNDAPRFTIGADRSADAATGEQTVGAWATGFNPGGGTDELTQSLVAYHVVNNSNPVLFAVAPTIDATGKLTYTPAASLGQTGTAIIGVTVQDSGGTDKGGVDTSTVQVFNITVNSNIASRDVVINEVAWMGTSADSNAEWIELYNTTNRDIDLGGWTLKSSSGGLNITIPKGTVIKGGQYFLLESGTDETIKDIAADLVYTGTLSNSGESLTLKTPDNVEIDTANGTGDAWFAGVYATGSPNVGIGMERVNAKQADTGSNWHNNNGVKRNGTDASGNLIYGTPKTANSLYIPPEVIVKLAPELTTTEGGGKTFFTVELKTIPTANVSINLNNSNSKEGQLSTTSLTFTPNNWNIPQTVTLTGQDDDVVDGNLEYAIALQPTISQDSNYNNIDPEDITFINNDDDILTVQITSLKTNVSETGSNQTSFRISRNSILDDLTVKLVATGTATQKDYSLSSNGLSVVIPQGQNYVDVTFTAIDDAIPELEESVQLTLASNSNYEVDPSKSSVTLTIAANDSISYNLSTTTTTVTETGNPQITFDVTRSGGTEIASTVDYAFGGTAAFNKDYNNVKFAENLMSSSSGTLNFAPGESKKSITLNIVDDSDFETQEELVLTLKNPNLTVPPESSQINQSEVTVSITDNDTKPIIKIDDFTIKEGKTALVTVSLSHASYQPVTVNYKTLDGTAKAGSDYQKIDLKPLVFNPGEVSKTIEVVANRDLEFEPSETFLIELTSANNATIEKNQATGTISLPNLIEDTSNTNSLMGTDESDRILGYDGDDKIIGGLEGDEIDAGDGNDTVFGDLINAVANSSAYLNDIIKGGNGSDRIFGGEGHDLIYGEAGDDWIWGNNGQDRIWGGSGNDYLTGGLGNDQFVFASGEGMDTINDFRVGEDVICLVNGLTFSDLSMTTVLGNTFIYDNSQQNTGSKILAIVMGVNSSALTNSSFIVEV